MNFKLGMSGLVLGLSVFACSVESAEDPADAEEASSTESDVVANVQKLAGSFTMTSGGASPTIDGLVLNANGTFFADIDTGIRCFRAPCPSSARIAGRFTATKSYVRLSPNAGDASTSYHGRYAYKLSSDASSLSLSKKTNGFEWSEQLSKGNSYCAAPVDCESQGLVHPMCVGSWTCGSSEANTCGYKCGGVVPAALIPADATQFTASSPGGGFRPAAPVGSTCAPGMQKYTYDVAAKTVAWEQCTASAPNKPYAMTSGSTHLTAAKLTKVKAAIAGLAVSNGDICGADKPWLTIDVASATDPKSLYDEFYSCQGGDKQYVSGIDAVFSSLRDASN